jgi:Right handed beta helix region
MGSDRRAGDDRRIFSPERDVIMIEERRGRFADTKSRTTIFLLAELALLVSAGRMLSAQETATVVLQPGQNIQAIVARSPEGTRFRFEPGIYRQQTIYPKSRQSFIGQDGVILSGAMELRAWTKEPEFWKSERLPHPLRFHGECANGRDLCKLREDLFFNDRLYERVEFLEDLGPGRWYLENRQAYLADDPTVQSVDLGVTELAFGGDAEGVVLKDLIVEKYASDAQHGAIHVPDARGWRISGVTARWNHGTGLSFGSRTLVTRGSFIHNGQLGMAGIGEGSRIQGVEIAFNNYAGYDGRWEAGGTKFWATKGLIVRDSCIHHNGGPGLWTDHDNINVIYQGNKVFMNANEGIKHEISYDAIVRDNVVAANGKDHDNWLWGSQILIQNSSGAKVYRNLVEVSNKFGNGIGVIHQDRGDGAYGPWDAINNSIYQNTIVHLGNQGQSGVVADADHDWFWREADNRFDRNIYIVADPWAEYWTSNERDEVWHNLEDLGFEREGKLVVEQRAPLELSCER